MICTASRHQTLTRADALTIWAAARERAVDELTSRAAQFTREGREDEAAGLRAAARMLRLRAVHERAQAAAYGADLTIRHSGLGGRGWAGSPRERSRALSVRGRLSVVL